MAKRFTDTDKWRKPWFRALGHRAKFVWIYLTDNCDHAGFWPAAFDLLSGDVGFEVTEADLDNWFGDKIERFGDKILLLPFIEFQYGALNPTNRVHQSVIQRLEKEAKNKPLVSPLQGAKDKNKDKDKDKDISSEGGVGETKARASQTTSLSLAPPPNYVAFRNSIDPRFDFDSLFANYPRQENRDAGMLYLRGKIATQDDFDALAIAIQHYSALCKKRKTESTKIKTWSSFIGVGDVRPWRDYIQRPAELDAIGQPSGRESREEMHERLLREHEVYQRRKAEIYGAGV